MRTVESFQLEDACAVSETAAPAGGVARISESCWRAAAPAKLNLGLRVYPVRADGFHDIESWFVPLSWHDTVTVSRPGSATPLDPPTGHLELVVTGRTEGIPTDPAQNLVGRAAMKLAEWAGIEPAARIELHKVLPPGGGLGGGSADAAMTLRALVRLWDMDISKEELSGIAAGLGSDVPFFVGGEAALCTGRGEVVSALPPRHPLFAVLIVPAQGLSTREVFRTFDAGAKCGNLAEIDWNSFAELPATELNEILTNDLEAPAFLLAPWLGQIKETVAAVVGQKVHMTGSGSTLFTLCPSGHAASEICRKLAAELSGDTTCVPVRVFNQR